jgi:DNA-binding transcriptional LysR family regulator
MQRLSGVPLAAIVVEGRYASIVAAEHAPGGWLADILARLQVRYPEIQVVFADTRRFAEEWTYRFLASALADSSPEPPDTT